ncbi:MAG: hypothetical protein AABY33_09980 [Pseudomonadota bacterium]
MTENTNIAPAQNIAPAERPELKSDQTWYNSTVTQLLAPLVGMRYIWLALEEINPLNFWGKDKPEIDRDKKGNPKIKNGRAITTEGKYITSDGRPWKEDSFRRYASRNSPALGIGAGVLLLVGMYSKNTLSDIKSIYAEAVGYELGKNSKDVTIDDVFRKSKNEAIEVTCRAYLARTAARMLAAMSFFVPWEKFRAKPFRAVQPKYDVNADAGVGAIGALIYWEGFVRKPSFFDVEQKLVSTKINHKDIDPYTAFQPQDIQALINLQRKHMDKRYKAPLVASAEGQNDVKLATRVAELLNIAYDNKPDITSDKFTIGKLNYLIGFKLLDKFPESLAYVELANKFVDMNEVKQAASAIKAGENVDGVFARFGVDMQKLAAKAEQQTPAPATESKKFTQDIEPKTLMDFAAKSAEPNIKSI